MSRRSGWLLAGWLIAGLPGWQPAMGDAGDVEIIPAEDVPAIEEHATIMGTDMAVLIVGEEAHVARRAIRAGFEEMRRIDALLTDWRDSPFERINQQAGIEPVTVGDEILFLIAESIRVSRLTNGAFDITFAGAGRLWDFKRQPPVLPDPEAIRAALTHVGYARIRVDPERRTVFLPHRGMRIGLGGIAKGYAVDRVVRKLRRMGLENFAVNAGGDLTVRGTRAGKLWWVGIRHPRNRAENIALLPISNGSVVTSGDSERFFILDDVRYNHILDPTTGYPATRSQSVTIVARQATLADAFATGVFVMGPEAGMQLIESMDHLEGMIVDADGGLHVSSGLQTRRGGPRKTL